MGVGTLRRHHRSVPATAAPAQPTASEEQILSLQEQLEQAVRQIEERTQERDSALARVSELEELLTKP